MRRPFGIRLRLIFLSEIKEKELIDNIDIYIIYIPLLV
ncbi:hypothetical protein UYSO10_3003 [Kosakonia radicincitans]|nr:hypothetical protein UYSO10_3003 [Kosakonia radicincitans]